MAGKMHNGILLFLGLCLFLAMAACGESKAPGQGEEAAKAPQALELPDDFIEFYKRFHNDSVYQKSHIVFPLQSTTHDTLTGDSIVTWTSENWVLHKMVVPGEFWDIDFRIPANNVIVEYIYARDGSYYLERRFAKSSEDWYLIYYSGLLKQ